MPFLVAFALVVAGGFVWAQEDAGPAAPGITVRPLLDNGSVRVAHLVLMPGARETPHTTADTSLIVSVTRGDIEMVTGDTRARMTRQVGDVQVVERHVRSAQANVGTGPAEAIVISVKHDRTPGGTAPARGRPEGITSTEVLDAADAAVRRVEFEPGAREVIHTHPYDFVVIPITNGPMEVHLGGTTRIQTYAPGDAFFIGRGTPHAVGNPGRENVALLGVVIK